MFDKTKETIHVDGTVQLCRNSKNKQTQEEEENYVGFEEVYVNVAIDIQMNFLLSIWEGFTSIIWVTVEAGIWNIETNWKTRLLASCRFIRVLSPK